MSVDEEGKTEEETPIRYSLRKKPRMQESKTYTSQPRLLTRDQWRELDRLDTEYSSDERAGCKWVRIEVQMHTSFADLDVKRSSLRGICKRARKQREIQELMRCRDEYEECQTTITQLQEEADQERENVKQVIREKEVLHVVSEQWRIKSEKLMEEVQLLKREKTEAEKRAKKQSKQNAKTKEDMEAQVKSWKRKFEITNAVLMKEKETNEFLCQAMHQD